MARLSKPIRWSDHDIAPDDLALSISDDAPPSLSNRHARPSQSPSSDDIDPDLWELDDFDPSKDLPPVAEIIEGIFPSVGLCGLAGQSQSGKTVVALDMAKSLVLGQNWLGKYNVPHACGVAYLPYESRANVKRRWRAIFLDSGNQTGNVPFQLLKSPPVMSSLREWSGFAATLAVINDKFLRDHGVPLKAVFIDTLAASGMVARENEADAWAVVIDNLNRICEALDIVIILLHHAAKSQESENIWRGSSSSYAALEVILGVKVDKVEGEVSRRWIYSDKSKDGDTGYIADLSFKAIKVGVKSSGADMFAPVLIADTDGERKIAAKQPEQKAPAFASSELAFMRAVKAAMQDSREEQPTQLSTGRWFYSAMQDATEEKARRFIGTKNFSRDFEKGRNLLLTRGTLELDDIKMRYEITVDEQI